jgi:hypothetical protein
VIYRSEHYLAKGLAKDEEIRITKFEELLNIVHSEHVCEACTERPEERDERQAIRWAIVFYVNDTTRKASVSSDA